MRYINFTGRLPAKNLTDAADKKASEISGMVDSEKRKEMLKKKSSAKVWGDFKDWLLEFSHGKCWFSDTLPNFSPFDVEHFRPKSTLTQDDGTVVDGYWWLAFDWSNFRVCGKLGNSKKGTRFPLLAGSQRAVDKASLGRERPVLIDPTNFLDVQLIGFNLEGDIEPSYLAKDPNEINRVRKTEELINLDYHRLVDLRKTVIQNCEYNMFKYLEAIDNFSATEDAMYRREAENYASAILNMISPSAQLSSVARYHIAIKQDDRLLCFLNQ